MPSAPRGAEPGSGLPKVGAVFGKAQLVGHCSSVFPTADLSSPNAGCLGAHLYIENQTLPSSSSFHSSYWDELSVNKVEELTEKRKKMVSDDYFPHLRQILNFGPDIPILRS